MSCWNLLKLSMFIGTTENWKISSCTVLKLAGLSAKMIGLLRKGQNYVGVISSQCNLATTYVLFHIVVISGTSTWHNTRFEWTNVCVWTCSTHANKSVQLWSPVCERSEFEFIDLIGSLSVSMWPIQLRAYTTPNDTWQVECTYVGMRLCLCIVANVTK